MCWVHQTRASIYGYYEIEHSSYANYQANYMLQFCFASCVQIRRFVHRRFITCVHNEYPQNETWNLSAEITTIWVSM